MKTTVHPQWYPEAKITCACGNTFTVGATVPELRVEICANCHPFFTGEMKYVDTMGRVERFQKKQAAAVVTSEQVAAKRKKKKEREEQLRSPKSLKDMLMGLK